MENEIFTAVEANFDEIALRVFRFQYEHNPVYRQYCELMRLNKEGPSTIDQVPFLPISFFKTHQVTTTSFEPQSVFESSGTTNTVNSRHYVKDLAIYRRSFSEAFQVFYGSPADWCIIALLPSYLERSNSSLVTMAANLIQQTGHPGSGFYLDEREKLRLTLARVERLQQKTLLIGVTFALLDFAEHCAMKLDHTIIMETGGMKGRRKELTRQQVHEKLRSSFQVSHIHSEYGMTELLSQAYSSQDGIFSCPPWMRLLVREEDDPLSTHSRGKGALNVIDLANLYSCAFIATDDGGEVYSNGSFEVLGRLDHADIRGCSLLTI